MPKDWENSLEMAKAFGTNIKETESWFKKAHLTSFSN